jgi:D-alanyl-D-alanine carboxypeptidase
MRRARPVGVVLGGAAAILAVLLSGCSAEAVAGSGGVPPSAVPGDPTPAPTPAPTPTPSPTPTPTPTFDKGAFSIDDPASIWVVVNKPRALTTLAFAPADLVYPEVAYVNRQPMRAPMAQALVAMLAAGKAEAGLDFSVQSAYRSFDSQTRVYADDVARHGTAYADTDTARPGHSEHQTGLAVDISAVPAKCSLDACFGDTPQGRWLAADAWRFGFILRYPADKVEVTGFTYEPWHFRFVGVPLSTELHRTGVSTLEEFFGLPGGQLYG